MKYMEGILLLCHEAKKSPADLGMETSLVFTSRVGRKTMATKLFLVSGRVFREGGQPPLQKMSSPNSEPSAICCKVTESVDVAKQHIGMGRQKRLTKGKEKYLSSVVP